MPDGLDSLSAMRAKTAGSRRSLPPLRHQPRRTPVPMPDPPPAPTHEAVTPASAVSDLPPPAAVTQPTTPVMPVPAAGAASELTKLSIYLDETTDNYLETVRAAARTARPRVDATRSAVVRLALTRLAEQLNPAAVVAELQRSAATHTGPGRKRA